MKGNFFIENNRKENDPVCDSLNGGWQEYIEKAVIFNDYNLLANQSI